MTFLTAYWKNLLFINFEIDPKVLEPFVPKGTELDFYNGKCYVSVVGFMFMDAKVLGIKLPGHVNFEEVNLRFYVKCGERRGTVFIKEIVPKPLITFVAKYFYHEHYATSKMRHHWKETNDSKMFQYEWQVKNKWQKISATTKTKPSKIVLNSMDEFITEHYFGYTKYKNKTFQYEVVHPIWEILEVKDHSVDMDFELNYGKPFSILNQMEPTSVILARGSEVTVKNKSTVHR
ncbi:MAG: DUF2071 domain-containing protein [Bacteroidota bacterium]